MNNKGFIGPGAINPIKKQDITLLIGVTLSYACWGLKINGEIYLLIMKIKMIPYFPISSHNLRTALTVEFVFFSSLIFYRFLWTLKFKKCTEYWKVSVSLTTIYLNLTTIKLLKCT